MEQARGRAIARREVSVRATEAIYRQLARDIAQWIDARADANGDLPASELDAFADFLERLLRDAGEAWQQEMGKALGDVLQTAEGLRPDGAPGSLVERTLRWLQDYQDFDGLQLSDRIWRNQQSTRQAVLDAVRTAVVRGEGARHAAMRLIAEGLAVPESVAVVIRDASGRAISGAVSNRIEGAAMRNALRVMRTEINRAYTEASVTAAFEHPDVAAMRFNLSPLHPRFDICDIYAKANLHGLGPGVYPQGGHPYPAHPETLSYLTVVFADEITDADRAGRESMEAWLRHAAPDEQDSLLGKHKGAAFRAGQIGEADFNTPWRELRARIETPA